MKQKIPQNIAQKIRIPKILTAFQLTMYMHLIDWKKKNITKSSGFYKGQKYDAILPDNLHGQLHPLYRPLLGDLQKHKFKPHKHFGSHMVSSQAACLNLFLPILRDKKVADEILPKINPWFKELAIDYLEDGFKFEYFDEDNPLNDHNAAAGTDSDLAIAYYDKEGLLSLWLIEHKLTEDDFTNCGGYISNRNNKRNNCKNGRLILKDHSKCYYSYQCKYRYWEVMDRSGLFNFDKHYLADNGKVMNCPFIDGKNQLWRNQLLGFAVQEKGSFQKVHFSVFYHEGNDELASTISSYKRLLSNSNVFSTFTSADIIHAARLIKDKFLNDWEQWYSEVYLC